MDNELSLASELEVKRSKAMVSGNIELLDAIYSDKLSYGHSSGLVDNKPEMLRKISTGSYDYHDIETNVLSATSTHKGLLIVMGNVKIDVDLNGIHRIMDSVYVGVYEKEDYTWKFIAHQTGLIKDRL